MSKALYRKYRPKCLEEVVGEKQVTDILSSALKNNKISQSYLFIGPRGCGKTSVARIFAHEINNFKYELEDNYVDIIEIDAASNTSVENIRDLREKAIVAPTKGKYKVYIIDEVHMLSKSAFNALLKTLEEPPRHVIFIMATTDAYKVPITITSRAQVFTFKLADKETMFSHVKNICEKESIKIDDDAIEIIVKRGGGSFRDTLSLLDQVSTLSEDRITKKNLIESLGLPEDELIRGVLASYEANELEKISCSLKSLFNTNVKPETIVEELITKIIDEPKPSLLPLLSSLSEIKSPFIEAKLLVALCGNQAPKVPTMPVVAEKPATAPTAPAAEEPAPATPVVEKPTTAPATVIMGTFLENLEKTSVAVFQQARGAIIQETADTIHIYPKAKTRYKILSNHKDYLITSGNGKKIEIHEPDDKPKDFVEDANISKISDIMGGAEEVIKNGGEIPF